MTNNIELYGFLQSGWHRTEVITDGENQTIYQGKSSINTDSPDMAVWCIKRVSITQTNNIQTIVEEFADGDMNFDNIWANRANLTYKYLQ